MKKNLFVTRRCQKNPHLRKILMTMKLMTVMFFLAISNLMATEAYSQNARLTLHLEDATVKEVLSKIEDNSEFFFLYNGKLVDVNRKVSVDATDEKISGILSDLFQETDVCWSVVDRQIVLTDKANQSSFANIGSQQQQLKITGTVTNKNGEPLPGVDVVVTGTSQGTITDVTGKFSIDVPQGAKSLTFTFIGMDPQEVSLGTSSQLNVTMTESSIGLGEVVVIGYGTVKKSDITGSMSTITRDKFNSGLVMAPEQLMQGKMAGVNITMQSGEPGANSDVLIRGANSISFSNSPLYVIDGVPVDFGTSNFSNSASDRMTTLSNNPLNMLNPSDIESINVLKDASATAIYGSRGANGVILVTTKKGKTGQSSISYEGSYGVSTLRKKLDVLSASDFRSYMKDNAVTGWVDGGASTDWQDQIFRTAITQSHSLSLNGGNDKTSYRASVNYTNQDGIIIASNLEKYTGRININHKALDDRLTIGLNLTNAFLKNHSAPNPEGAGGAGSGGTLRDALRNDPTYPVRDTSGAYTWHGVNNQNPVEETLVRTDITETYRYMGNGTADYKIFDFLNANMNIGFTKENVDRYVYEPITGRIGSVTNGHGSQESRASNSKLLETNLVFNKTFGKHSINALGGYSYQEFVYTNSFMESSNYISDETSYNSINSGNKSTWNLYSGKASNKLISFYTRATYDFNGKYLLTATLRRDGSSRFGADQKWGNFPSAALGWRVSEEDFLKSSNFISNLKLRIGYGITGNQEIGDYGSLPILSAGGQYIINGNFVGAVYPTQYANPNLKWESTAQSNIGLDFGIFKNRLTGTIDLYKKKTNDLLLSFTVPQPAEASNTTLNIGSVENKGIELELNGVILNEGPLAWEAYGNISHNVNNVVSISSSVWKQDAIYQGWLQVPGFSGQSTQIIMPGQSLGTFYGFRFAGVDANGKQQFYDRNNNLTYTPIAGKLGADDRAVIGHNQPKFIYGFGSKLTLNKRLSLDLFFRGVQGIQVLNSTFLDLSDKSGIYSAIASGRDNARINIANGAVSNGIAHTETLIYSSKWIQDASFLRLENVTVNYNFNVKSLKWVSNLNVYVTGQNLFVITKYKGYDPEVSGGNDSYKYPRPTTIQLGIRANFN